MLSYVYEECRLHIFLTAKPTQMVNVMARQCSLLLLVAAVTAFGAAGDSSKDVTGGYLLYDCDPDPRPPVLRRGGAGRAGAAPGAPRRRGLGARAHAGRGEREPRGERQAARGGPVRPVERDGGGLRRVPEQVGARRAGRGQADRRRRARRGLRAPLQLQPAVRDIPAGAAAHGERSEYPYVSSPVHAFLESN